MKYLRKIFLSFSLFGAVCAFADDYHIARIGLGGIYSLQQPSGEKDITNTGGYLALWGMDTYANERILLQFGLDIGLGKTKRDGAKNDTFVMDDLRISAGVNLLTQNIPLYLSVGYAWDSFNSGSGIVGAQLGSKDDDVLEN
ncbi:hypothetical protein OQH61_07670, partial [Helicobacter sp. MIT 21-1697]|nr:hypothetical protein [Helicobacter sp. MIT 21-1697]